MGGEGIIPLLDLIDGREYQLIGTGFFITSFGVFATAKHVIISAHERGRAIFIWQFIPLNQWLIRSVFQFSFHDIADIAIGVCSQARHDETSELLTDTRVRLTTSMYVIGDRAATYAYPSTIIQATEGGQILSFNPEF